MAVCALAGAGLEHARLGLCAPDARAPAVEAAARATGQYAPGRGTHGLKHSFAQARLHEAIDAGLSHEEAKQAVANEIAHNRLDSVEVYLR